MLKVTEGSATLSGLEHLHEVKATFTPAARRSFDGTTCGLHVVPSVLPTTKKCILHYFCLYGCFSPERYWYQYFKWLAPSLCRRLTAQKHVSLAGGPGYRLTCSC